MSNERQPGEVISPNPSGQVNQHFAIEKVYVKDSTLEAPNTPGIFRNQGAEWKPQVSMDLQTKGKPIEGDYHEVVLSITVTAKVKEDIAFLVEVHQAGIFIMKGFPENEMHAITGNLCPSILFPFAREAIADLVVRAGFPPLYLAPINFDALYRQHLSQQQQKADETSH